ncbi:polyadenylate binding protein [Microstroma glucosiphilum]|uniref:Polyadenylate-binding protein n=1 Tax=Pseudomicrostroma glucosiphilum TaxID=1684307 RepID=A0A316UAI3_9BASI|nr:polyadenylate binding protein [Pseudomicrostroma glucosiphilum]PWN22216.1 polyadenylate binding protein [Pseudomicrostroma glucosiphilum]
MSATSPKVDSKELPETNSTTTTEQQPAAAGDAAPDATAEQTSTAGNGAAAEASPAAPAPQQSNGASANSNNNQQSQNTSLYVGELDPSVTEAMLFEIFSMIGPVASIRVCRDAVTRRSLGYAYVNFINSNDGERALEQLNYSVIRGRPCRIMWSQRDPALRRTGQGNIFIKNLDEAIDNKALHDTFAAFGNILSCKVAIGEGGSLGYGFVHYETGEAADQAIQHVNGMLLNDKKVFVGHHVPKKERLQKIEEARAKFTNVFCKNIDVEVTQEEFEGLFKGYGSITSAVLSTDDEGKSRGFGFVNFEDHEQAQKAVDDLHDTEFHGQKLFVARAQKKNERDAELRQSFEAAKNEKLSKFQGVNLYLKNIPEEFDDERLREEFAPFGAITSCKIMRTTSGVSRGFGFVCYSAPDEANKAVAEMNGKMLDNKPLYVALAQRKEDRRQQLEAQIMQQNQIRLQQQAAAAGIPAGYPGQPLYFPQPGFPGQPGMVGQRPRYPAPGQMLPQAMPMAGPYGQFPAGMVPPSGYRPPRPPRGGPGMPPQAGGPRPPGGAGLNGAPRPGQPLPGRGMPAGARGPGGRQQYPPAQPTLTAAALANAGPEEQKQMLGEAIYPKIAENHPDLAGKLTGMILELPVSELLHVLEDGEALNSKVGEALQVLRDYETQQGGEDSGESKQEAA